MVTIVSAMLAASGLLSVQSFARNDSGEAQKSTASDAAQAAAPATDKAASRANAGKFVPVKWITIPGGKFMMGSNECGASGQPIHQVTIKTFQMSKTLVTVEQYAECVLKGPCTTPTVVYGPGDLNCNWWKKGRQRHPINCLDWNQANQYARFLGARLPSEAEWEYAARSGGKDQKYPWGNGKPTCEIAVMYANGGAGCGSGSTMPVCSKPKGNTKQGLCDMAGNVWEWVQDNWHDSYAPNAGVAPNDGSAWEKYAAGSDRVIRGGCWGSFADDLRSAYRLDVDPLERNADLGFRVAKSNP